MDVTWLQLLTLALTSGVVAGITNQSLSLLRESRERSFKKRQQQEDRQHQLALQGSEREHAARLRSEEAHSEARAVLLEHAVDARDWINKLFIDRHGDEIDYIGVNLPVPRLSSVVDVLKVLSRIEFEHPTGLVRKMASSLRGSIDGEYNMVNGQQLGEPSEAEIRKWMRQSEVLIEAIHDGGAGQAEIEQAFPHLPTPPRV